MVALLFSGSRSLIRHDLLERLMIDAARHFQPVDVIKRNLNAMASMKMNVFHWHLADDQGWRIKKKHPN
jgi:N-acetyl-beta-hexosaminidase